MNPCESNCGDQGKQDLQHTVYLFDGFQLDVTRRKLVSSGGLVQSLNSRAMDALLLLVTNAGELVEKRRLMQTVWPNSIVEDNNLNQCVLAIRRALGETAGSNRYIMTVPGRGYRFVCPVREVAQESLAEATTHARKRRRTSPVSWMILAGVVCAMLLGVVLLRGVPPLLSQGVTAELLPTPGQSVPALQLRLQEARAFVAKVAGTDLALLVMQCLAARSDLNLQVQIRLVTDDGEPAWTRSFPADLENPRASMLAGSPEDSGCRDLTGAENDKSPDHSRDRGFLR